MAAGREGRILTFLTDYKRTISKIVEGLLTLF